MSPWRGLVGVVGAAGISGWGGARLCLRRRFWRPALPGRLNALVEVDGDVELTGDVGELLRQVLHCGACGLLHGFAGGGAGQGTIDCGKQGAHAAIDAQGLGEHFFE